MASYPKPDGWQGGSGGSFMRQGTAGHLSQNPNVGDLQNAPNRSNESPIGDLCFSGEGDGDEY